MARLIRMHHVWRWASVMVLVALDARFGSSAVGDDEVPPAIVRGERQLPAWAANQMDYWLYGGGLNADSARDKLETILGVQIADIDQACGLSGLQKKKLRLAGHGDIKHYFDRVAETRSAFDRVKGDAQKVIQLAQGIESLSAIASAAPFGEGTVFAKALNSTLRPDQSSKYSLPERSKGLAGFVDAVNAIIERAKLLSKLSDLQCDLYRRLLLNSTRPARIPGICDEAVILLQAAKLPESEVRPIFNNDQWPTIAGQFAQIKRIEPTLREFGCLP
ncbi:hypothetical protein ACYOEI_04065 [Singulisphaera rosea]